MFSTVISNIVGARKVFCIGEPKKMIEECGSTNLSCNVADILYCYNVSAYTKVLRKRNGRAGKRKQLMRCDHKWWGRHEVFRIWDETTTVTTLDAPFWFLLPIISGTIRASQLLGTKVNKGCRLAERKFKNDLLVRKFLKNENSKPARQTGTVRFNDKPVFAPISVIIH